MISAGELRARAEKAFGKPSYVGRNALRFGKKGSVSVQLTGDKAGCWYDFEASEGGSLLHKDELPERREYTQQRRGLQEIDRKGKEQIQLIMKDIRGLHGTISEQYLNSRAITEWPHCIKTDKAGWTVIALATTVDGSVHAIQRIFLDKDAKKLKVPTATGESAKITRAMGKNWHHNAAVRYPGKGEPILCEGVETGLSIWMATKRPVLVCLGNAGFDGLRVSGKKLTIARDGDQPDSPADKRIMAAVHNRKRTHKVKLTATPPGWDFNDIHRHPKGGLEAVRRIINAAEVQ